MPQLLGPAHGVVQPVPGKQGGQAGGLRVEGAASAAPPQGALRNLLPSISPPLKTAAAGREVELEVEAEVQTPAQDGVREIESQDQAVFFRSSGFSFPPSVFLLEAFWSSRRGSPTMI